MKTRILRVCVARLAFAALVFGLLAPLPAPAEIILIDFGNNSSYRGASVSNPDSSGNYWNSVWSGAYYSNLVDTDNNGTGYGFGFASAGGTDYYNGPSGTNANPALSVYNATALGNLGTDEAVYDWYSDSTFVLESLNPALTYSLTFYGSRQYPADDTTTRYTIYDDNTYANPITSADLVIGDGGNGHNQDTVVTISGLVPQGAGNAIYVGFAGNAGGTGYINAMQVEAIPEPGTLALLLGGGLLLHLRRRKR